MCSVPVPAFACPCRTGTASAGKARGIYGGSPYSAFGFSFGCNELRFRTSGLALEADHLHRRSGRFESFVSGLESGPVQGLLQVLAGQDAIGVRYTGLLR